MADIENGDTLPEDTTVVDESAVDSLKPNSSPTDSDPRTKVEVLASMIGAAAAMPTSELVKWFDGMMANKYTADVGSADANRATQNMSAGGTPLAPQPMVKISAKEDVDAVFAGETLTEEARDKISTLFEAAVSARVGVETVALEEAYEALLTEEIEGFITETTKNINDYIDYAVTQWINENEVAVVDSLRLENTEDFMEKLKNLFTESYIDVPEDRLDVVREVSEKVVDLETKLNSTIAENVELKRTLVEKDKASVISTVSEGLTLSDSEKFKTLIENIEYTNTADYTKKLKLVQETYIQSKKPAISEQSGDVNTLNEEAPVALGKEAVITDPFVAAAAKMMNVTTFHD